MSKYRVKEKNIKISASSDCPLCKGTGKVLIDEYKPEVYGENQPPVVFAEDCPRCNGVSSSTISFARDRANIPVRYYDADISKFDRNIYKDGSGKIIDISKKMQLIDNFIDDYPTWKADGMGFYIHSSIKGSGKTFLASCICNSLMAKYSTRVRFVSASNLLELSKRDNRNDTNEIETLCNFELLVIDDLGQQNGGHDWMNDVLFRITDTRMQKKLATIYTSNVRVENLDFDDRIVERIQSMCYSISLPEICVRARDTNDKKEQFLKKIGLAV